MSQQKEAMQLLLSVRRHLSDRLASELVTYQQTIVQDSETRADPFGSVPGIPKLAERLTQVNQSMLALRGPQVKTRTATDESGAPTTPSNSGVFAAYFNLLQQGRLEDGARELARLFRLRGDSAFTATRYFIRAAAATPAIRDRLVRLCEEIETRPVPACMRDLMAAFGFQAVESMTAIQAIRDHRRAFIPPDANPHPPLVANPLFEAT